MLPIYLPIAELSMDVVTLLGSGALVGFLSGLFGVGGGFLLTPLLLLLGVPPTVAVATQAPQIVASSVTGVMAHWRRDNVDVQMGVVLVISGMLGSVLGVLLFAWLRSLGQIDVAISIAYVVLLGSVGSLMMIEAVKALMRRGDQAGARRKLHQHSWLHNLPFKYRFRKSRLYISLLPPGVIGLLVGMLAAIMGVGGGFILVPALIFVIGMPTMLAVGTSLFQIIFVTAATTVLHAVSTQTVDIVMALLLAVGGVVGATYGAGFGQQLKAEQLRGLFAALVLAVAVKVGYDLTVTPADVYSLTN